MSRILKDEHDIIVGSRQLEATEFEGRSLRALSAVPSS
jgi:hypothetical protein